MSRTEREDSVPVKRGLMRHDGRPAPDEAPLDDIASKRRLSGRDWFGITKRALKRTFADNMPMIAQALAYSSFLAMPAVLLVVVGVFSLVAGPAAITSLMHHLSAVMPKETTQLLGSSLSRLNSHPGTGITMTIVGFVLAIWSTTGAMTSFMAGLNIAYDCDETRGFVRKRLLALGMSACIGAAFVLVAVLLIFGPAIEHYVGEALGIQGALRYVWWAAQWPILLAGLLASFATLLHLGPNLDQRRWSFLSAGTGAAVAIWLAASGLFAFYTANFGSYNKTWGALAAVIIMLTWLWLTSLALLFGGELNAEAERTRARGSVS